VAGSGEDGNSVKSRQFLRLAENLLQFLTEENAVDLHSRAESLNIRDNGRWKTYRSCRNHESITV
jgi:hypothetical protein